LKSGSCRIWVEGGVAASGLLADTSRPIVAAKKLWPRFQTADGVPSLFRPYRAELLFAECSQGGALGCVIAALQAFM
jgi:hypothetical protein